MKRVLLITGVALLLSAAVAQAQAQIRTGKHDFSTGSALTNTSGAINAQTCVFCHTPHGGALLIPLWNRAPATGAFDLYTSTTMDATTSAATIQGSVSGACLSCHDGVIGIDVLTNLNGAAFAGAGASFTAAVPGNYTIAGTVRLTGGRAALGIDLRNDHPISITYETARAAQTTSEFVTLGASGSKITANGGTTGELPLYGTTIGNATVECASCHNPHSNTNTPFLRKANTGSQICLTCHVK